MEITKEEQEKELEKQLIELIKLMDSDDHAAILLIIRMYYDLRLDEDGTKKISGDLVFYDFKVEVKMEVKNKDECNTET